MPRPLEQENSKAASGIQLTESPNSVGTESPEASSPSPDPQRFVIVPEAQQLKGPTNLHPYTRPLTVADLESCLALENAAFTNPEERATREKLKYRLSRCGEICLGIFCTVVPGSGLEAATFATGKQVETSRQNGARSVLLGHVIAAKTDDGTASDASMALPKDWKSPMPAKTNVGHQEAGRTIALHSIAILPSFQGRGLGRVLVMAYMQQMNGAGIADRLALIAHDHKINWYGKLGFTNRGKSTAHFGGGGWYDMIFELKSLEPRASYG